MKKNFLSPADIEQISSMGISREHIFSQLDMFKRGAKPVELVKPATINDGIVRLTEKECQKLIKTFSSVSRSAKIIKFVPASGAASRMFNVLNNFNLRSEEINEPEIYKEAESGDINFKFLLQFINGIKNQKFGFFDDLKGLMEKKGIKIEHSILQGKYGQIIEYLLLPKGLNYLNLPKALIPFHKYKKYSRTFLEEHLIEGMAYSKDNSNCVHIHFTVSSEFKQKITDFTHSILHKFNKEPVTFNIQFSEQKTSTNTIAVDGNNNPFRDKSSKLVLRPGGHGALIKNINTLEGDIIFIKNIDNVVPDTLKEETIKFKKILGVILINIQSEVFKSLKRLTSGKMTEEEIKRITQMAKNVLNICYPDKYEKWPLEKKQHYLLENLNRPIRICGMVKNEGEPGGGPFWVRNKDNKVSLQIVETAQINKESDTQRKIFEQSTHFNPVDMVCGIRNYNGDKFNLFNYVDPDTYYISEKSMSGKTVKALELPGLWNGAMANWITIFIEVPVTTFNPVKTVNDLLKKVE